MEGRGGEDLRSEGGGEGSGGEDLRSEGGGEGRGEMWRV